jgi:UDPglucose 6-dehydrogenase
VTAALGCDTRIGTKYLKGALGYGGPCFPRDNVAFSALARDNGVPALLAEATDALNKRQVPRLAKLVLSQLPKGGTVGVLGLSYKPNTEVIEESQGVAIAQALLASGARVVVYDPAAMENAKRVLNGDTIFAASAAECVRQSDVLAITTPWAEFQELPLSAFQRSGGDITVLDCWRVLPKRVVECIENYLTLGKAGAREYSLSTAPGL